MCVDSAAVGPVAKEGNLNVIFRVCACVLGKGWIQLYCSFKITMETFHSLHVYLATTNPNTQT